jgi:hypothetical protein
MEIARQEISLPGAAVPCHVRRPNGRVMMAMPGMVESALAAVADVLVAPRRRRSHAGGRRQNLPARDGQ